MLLERVREERRHGLENFVAPLAAPLIFLPRLPASRRVLDGDRESIGSFPFSSSLLPRPVQALDAWIGNPVKWNGQRAEDVRPGMWCAARAEEAVRRLRRAAAPGLFASVSTAASSS